MINAIVRANAIVTKESYLLYIYIVTIISDIKST